MIAAIVAAAPGASAQRSTNGPLTNVIIRDDGTPVQLPSRAGGFSLFAEEDLAGTSLRLTGTYRYAFVNAGGLCPFANTAGDIFNTQCGAFNGSSYFHVNPVWGIGLGDYSKIVAAYPGVARMRAPIGFSTPWRITSIAPITRRIDAADGQFGQFFSGVTSLAGAGCRDMTGTSGAGLPANFTLTASQDCPDTWAATGFDGVRQIPDSVWLKRFQADPAGFRWDDWKVPAADQSEAPLGNNSTYGSFSDYPRQMLQLFGNVTPMGDAGTPPGERGFPIGIYVRADVWKFDRPSLRNGVFVRWLIVNNSEKVWGKPIDYDKIYMGVDPGYIISGQSPAAYNLPGRGVHIGSGGGMSGRCTNTFPKRAPPGNTEGCEGNATLAPRVIMILKSPLGDLRNKLFTNPTSSYYDPSSPKADDTITFNHWRRGGFGAQDNFSWRRSDRALFGLLSGDEDLWLDGRSATDFSAVNIWRYFRYEFTDGTGDVRNLRYNRSVPGDIPGYGKWDYNDDGIQDTLKVPDCGVAGCSALWSDSIAGGYSNMNAGNIGNFLGFGPFALKAHDTTEVLWYLGAATDTLQTNRLIASVTDAYLKNYAGASAYPAPVVTTNDVQLNTAWFRDSTASSQTTEIRIQVKMPPRRDDAFLASVVDRLTSNDPVAVNLRNLNPDLLATVEGRMRENLAQVLVFKSCDNGVSWTSDVGCTASTGTFRTRDQDGTDVGLGWRPRFTINADTTTGALSTNVVSDVVQAGRDYTYAFVTKTRSLADISVVTRLTTDNSGGIVDLQRDNLQNVLGVDIDSITSSLSPNGPSSVHVYAPISVPAGTIYATLDTVRAQESSTTNRVTADARTASVNGVFRMRFGNRFILTRTIDTSADAHTTTLIRQSLYSRAALSPTDPTFTPNFVAAADTFTANHDITYSARSTQALRTTPRSVTGSVETFVDTLGVAGYVVANGTTGEPYYLAVGTNSSDFRPFASNSGITQSTAEFEGAAWYPGFTVTITAETTNPSPRQSFVLRGPDDTLRSTVVSTNGVVYSVVNPPRGAAVTLGLRDSPGGFFRVHWEDDSFGPNSPFRLTIDPTALETTVNASLSARRVAGTTDTSSKYRATILATADGASSNGANVIGVGVGLVLGLQVLIDLPVEVSFPVVVGVLLHG